MFSRHIIKKLDLLLDGRLSAKQRAKVESHLQQCDSCRKEWELQTALWQKLAVAPDIAASTAFTERVLRGVDSLPADLGAGVFDESRRGWLPEKEEDADAHRGWSAVWRWVVAPAAAVVVGVAVSVVVFATRDTNLKNNSSPAEPNKNANTIVKSPRNTTTNAQVTTFEQKLRAHVAPDEAEKILKDLYDLPFEERGDYMLKIWEQHGLSKDELKNPQN